MNDKHSSFFCGYNLQKVNPYDIQQYISKLPLNEISDIRDVYIKSQEMYINYQAENYTDALKMWETIVDVCDNVVRDRRNSKLNELV